MRFGRGGQAHTAPCRACLAAMVWQVELRSAGEFRRLEARIRSPPDENRASDHQAQGNRHQYRTDEPLTQVEVLDIGQRHLASMGASWVRTTYAHRTCLRTGRSQALGSQRSPAMEQHRRYK